ncbi:MAG: hypothetical protein ACRDYV_18680, partial [Acidimicrobiia bacterium]
LPALAHHWGRATGHAEAGGRAIEYANRAGDQALALLAHDEAAAYYSQALDIFELARAGDPSLRLDLLIKRGEAQRRAGDPSHRETLLTAGRLARELGDGPAAARAALANSRGFWASVGRVDEDRVAALESALEMGPKDGATRARLLATLAGEVTYGPDLKRTPQLADEALRTARQLDDRRTLAHVLMARGFLLGLDTAHQRMAESAELLALAGELHDPMLKFLGMFARVVAAFEVGEPAEARTCLQRAQELTGTVRQPFLRWAIALEDALVGLFDADYTRAEQLITRGEEMGDAAGQPDGRLLASAQRVYLRLEQGRGGEMEGVVGEMVARSPGHAAFRSQLALCQWQGGREQEATSGVLALLGNVELLPREAGWSRALAQ